MSDDCLFCGTCCFSTLETYVSVTGDDHARLGDHAEQYVQFTHNKAFMRMHDGHCAALAIDAERGRFVCSIYEVRPETCRTLERGSPACDGERWAKSERPVRALAIARG